MASILALMSSFLLIKVVIIMASVWQNNKMLRKWEQKNFKRIANGDFNYNLAYPLEDPLIIAISNNLNIKKDCIYVGAGSSQFIGALVGLKLWRKIFLSNIEFSLYKRTAELADKKITLLNGLTTNDILISLAKTKSDERDLLCISSPRWFNGEMFTIKQIKEILKIFNGTILIDEAYIDYSDNEKGLLDLCLKNERIIILRTFSKKFLASGYRTGYMITKKNIEGMRNTIIPPHSVSSYSERFFVELLSDNKILKAFEETRNYIKLNRDLIYNEFKDYKQIKVIKSDANFISIIFKDNILMEKTYDNLKELAGIQKFDNVVPFIKIWVNNEIFSKEVIKRIKEIIK